MNTKLTSLKAYFEVLEQDFFQMNLLKLIISVITDAYNYL